MNVYVRNNNNDLLKYLSEEEIKSVTLPSIKIEASPNQLMNLDKKTVNVLERGIINVISPKTGKLINTLSPGEIFGEELLFQNEWCLSYITETQTVFIKYQLDFSEVSDNPNIVAKIHAAINDSLAEKLMRLTQATVRKSDNENS